MTGLRDLLKVNIKVTGARGPSFDPGSVFDVPTIRAYDGSGKGYIQIVSSDTTYTGALEYYDPTGTRLGFSGYGTIGGVITHYSSVGWVYYAALGHKFTGSTVLFDHLIAVQDAPGNPYIAVNVGNSTITGQVQFRDPSAVRASIGSVSASGALLFASVNGAGFSFTITGQPNFLNIGPTSATFGTTVAFANDGNFTLSEVSGNPRLTLDANDFIEFNRSGNQFSLNVAGSYVLAASAGGVTIAGSTNFNGDAQFYANKAGSNPRVTFDSNDYLEFDRTANQHNSYVGGTKVAALGSSALDLQSNVGLQMAGNDVINSSRHLVLRQYTRAGLPTPTGSNTGMAYVTNPESGHTKQVYNDGSTWTYLEAGSTAVTIGP